MAGIPVEFDETVVNQFSCKRCDRTFKSKRDQTLHRQEVHNHNKTTYECKLCAKNFCNSGNLDRHMKVHNDVRPFVCNICSKAFAQAVNLQRHYAVHSGERPYQCTFCNKSFTQQSNMKRHKMTHTGEKPFRCQRCGRYFSQLVNLKKHKLGHLNAKPYQCNYCEKGFTQLSNFKRHLQSHIKEGVDVDVAGAIQQATALARERLEAEQKPSFFECMICRAIFETFGDYEKHEGKCHVDHERSQIEVNQMSHMHADDYLPMKFSVPDLDTHEIIIETTH
ncbi:hypothetical protein AWZ03_012191 [Drosophila navojoa]|uniref:C2H2-type domain-containing protein n=2 Tax=Drosophila navojoa TaxID=7232 RepID=A0A484AXM2_DRONA|nr:zinc finger protein 239 isoform X2 [Drosophila navojoa]TDG41387.1 hypothetical protein AWZ03_012191 [Drosophila navojoa]